MEPCLNFLIEAAERWKASESLGRVCRGGRGAEAGRQGVDQLGRVDEERHRFGKTQGRHIHESCLSSDSSSNV